MSNQTEPLLLYVEDEPLVQEIGVLTLESAGYGVVAAQSAPEAFSALTACGAAIKAVVTDIKLPGDGSGWDIAKRARELLPNIPVVYVSGGNSHEWPAMGVPGSVMVAKPYAAAQLIAAVSALKLCASGAARDASRRAP
jgi:CheY-like chemotaxis protein